MTIKCLSKTIPQSIREQLGWADKVNPHYQITVGKVYVVYAVCAVIQGSPGNLLWNVLYIVDDQGRLTQAPACLFDAEESKVSSQWQVKITREKLSLGCDMLLDEEVSNRLVEGDQELWKKFLIIKAQIDEESSAA